VVHYLKKLMQPPSVGIEHCFTVRMPANVPLFVLLFLCCSPWVHVVCFITVTTSTTSKSYHSFLPNGAKLACRLESSTTRDDAGTKDCLFRSNVHVYDNVVPPDACEAIRYLALDHAGRCGGSCSVFYWHVRSNKEDNNYCNNLLLTPLEQALRSILEQLMPRDRDHATDTNNDESWIVEYWSREEYMNMDTHSDIDEQLLLNDAVIKCPD
jgi:hypothetical protein